MKRTTKGGTPSKNQVKREQPRKDSRQKRVNYDNERVSKWDKTTCETKGSNDVRWYAKNEELLRSAASLPFSTVTGGRVPGNGGQGFPGVMAITYAPWVGATANNIYNINAVNQAATSLYSYTVHANSRNQSYDAPDEMMLVLAGTSLFSAIGMGIRAYGAMKVFDQRNMYLPEGLIRAMGFDYQDLKDHLSDMWFDINEMIARSRQIWIPNTLPLTERWFWMNTNIYTDSDSPKAQYYLYTPAYFLKLSDRTQSEPTSLDAVGWGGTPATWATYKSMINELFGALLNSQDRGIIFGDILKAFGEERIYKLNEISADYTVIPIYDREVLSQIENSTTTYCALKGIVQNTVTNQIYAEVDTVNRTAVDAGFAPLISGTILNFHQKEIPTPAQVMVATRMCSQSPMVIPDGDTGCKIYPQIAGTEVCLSYTIYYMAYAYGVPSYQTVGFGSGYPTQTISNDNFKQIEALSQFDWAPFRYRVEFSGEFPYTVRMKGIFGDTDMWTTLEWSELDKMHQTAVYSEFGVPIM